jgi:hypothetical protein
MGNIDWIGYKIEVRDRLKLLALDILKLSEMIPEATVGKVINYLNAANHAQKSLLLTQSSSISFNLFLSFSIS